MAGKPVFLDTSLLVAASVAAHPGHAAASAYLAERVEERAPLCLSPQICREFHVVLTRQPVSGRSFSVNEALGALDKWRGAANLLPENKATVARWRSLVVKHEVRGKQAHDCNIVAVMLEHGIGRLATRNAADFRRYEGIAVEAIRP